MRRLGELSGVYDLFSAFPAFRNPNVASLGIVVIGAGALGSELALLLAKSEISKVLLLDPGHLERRNLASSTFLSQAFAQDESPEASLFKAHLLRAEAARSWKLSWSGTVAEIADTGLATLADYDVLCCCTDSALSRAETALAARLLGLPMLDCGVFGDGISKGRVTWFAAQQNAACYLCGMTENRRAELLAYATSASLGCAPSPQDIPMTGTTSAVQHTARKAMDLLEHFLAGTCPPCSTAWQLSQDSTSGVWSSNTIVLPHSELCPWHDPLPAPLVSLPWDEPIATSLQRHFPDNTAPVLQLHWPICTRAVCRHCGTAMTPMHRVAWVRRRLHCSHCNSLGTLEPLACVSTVALHDSLAACTPRQLHLPEHHLYRLRHTITFSMPGKEPE